MSAVRIGITAMGDGPVDAAASAMQTLADRLPQERRGHLWIAEAYLFRDALAQAAIALARTSSARVAVGVANVYTRHPALLAMSAATLDEAFPGRFVLGVGAGQAAWMRQLGVASPTPMRDVERACELFAALRDDGRGTLELAGLRTAELKLTRGLRRPVPVVVGTNGPKTVAMAGRSADGVLLSFYDGDAARLAELVGAFGAAAAERQESQHGIGCVAQCFAVGSWLEPEQRERVEALCARLGAMAPPERRPRAFALDRDSLHALLAELEQAGVREAALVAPHGTEAQLAEFVAGALESKDHEETTT